MKLTVEKLKNLPFELRNHFNGGSKWSGVIKDNEEYGLIYSHRTNGRPEYKLTQCWITTSDQEITADLLADDLEAELERFVAAYNSRSPNDTTKSTGESP